MTEFISFISALVIHELGHIAAAKLLGVKTISFTPGMCGAMLAFDFCNVGYIREAAVHLSGGIFGIAASLFVYLLFGERALFFCGISVYLTVLNWMPIEGLDGSAFFRAVLSKFMMPDTVCRAVRTVSFITTVLFWCAVLGIELRSSGNLSCIILAVSLLLALLDKKVI